MKNKIINSAKGENYLKSLAELLFLVLSIHSCQKEKGYLKKSFQKQIGVKKLPRIILIGCSLLFFIF